jgi:hypothetical protein
VQRATGIFALCTGVLPASKTRVPGAKSVFAHGPGVKSASKEEKLSSTALVQRAKDVFAPGAQVKPASKEVNLSSTALVQRAKDIFAHGTGELPASTTSLQRATRAVAPCTGEVLSCRTPLPGAKSIFALVFIPEL